MRIVNIHQPNYVPALSYFAKMAAADIFVSLDDVEYSKNNWTNRNQLKGPNGPMWLTIPVRYANGSRQQINEIETVSESNWQTKHWRTITANYSRAPFFGTYKDLLNTIYEVKWGKLGQINEALLEQVSGWLDITSHTCIVRSSTLNVEGTSSERLVRLCQAVGGNAYLCGSGGLKYLDVDAFKRAGIEVMVHENVEHEYRQCWGPFVERLSVLDALLNIGGSEVSKLIKRGHGVRTV